MRFSLAIVEVVKPIWVRGQRRLKSDPKVTRPDDFPSRTNPEWLATTSLSLSTGADTGTYELKTERSADSCECCSKELFDISQSEGYLSMYYYCSSSFYNKKANTPHPQPCLPFRDPGIWTGMAAEIGVDSRGGAVTFWPPCQLLSR